MLTRRVLALALAMGSTTLFTPSARAQSISPGSGPYAGAGIELIGFRDGSTITPGRTLQLGYSFAPRGRAVSLRVEGGLFDRHRATLGWTSRAQIASVNLSVAYRFGNGRTQPYLIGGAGFNAVSGGTSSGGPVIGGTGTVTSVHSNSASALAGVGLQRRVLGAWIFTEARYTVFTNGQGFPTHIMPLTVGLRF